MRTQITVYLDEQTKKWLAKYARQTHLKESEVVRFLIQREREVGWLQWAIQQRDPAQRGSSKTLKAIAEAKKKAT